MGDRISVNSADGDVYELRKFINPVGHTVSTEKYQKPNINKHLYLLFWICDSTLFIILIIYVLISYCKGGTVYASEIGNRSNICF